MIGKQDRWQEDLFVAGPLSSLVPDDHVLRRVDSVLDLSWLHKQVSELYCDANGRPSIDPEAALRLMLAGFFQGIVHDRKLMKEAQVNLLGGIERDELGRKFSREVREGFREQYSKLFPEFESMDYGGLWGRCSPANRKAVRQRATDDPEFKAMIDAFRDQVNQAWNKANRIQSEKIERLQKDLNTKAAVQTKIAQNLACISPLADFVYLATDLTGTGLRSLDCFERTKKEYGKLFWPYLRKKGQEAVKNDPTYTTNSFLDVSDRPRFVFKEELLKDKLNAVLPYWGILVLFNVLFFAMAFVGFLRYDVR